MSDRSFPPRLEQRKFCGLIPRVPFARGICFFLLLHTVGCKLHLLQRRWSSPQPRRCFQRNRVEADDSWLPLGRQEFFCLRQSVVALASSRRLRGCVASYKMPGL